ncbi:MocR-like B6 salvage transcription factor PtsJ [Herbaspirillum sp. B65]|uniref:MocR-like B6 salvage transcription factor PtsJ n=1 Tax=Herbaspirillum sp. B65 TaxID=137708 RepID=UPI00034DDF5F|nr:transcriptional regulator PtsJ [Herbaspirillum sp. B65]
MKIQGKTAADIFECVRALVQTQRLQAGQALPPVRELAEQLGLNRNTVAAAYRRLATAGIAITQGRLGTVIRAPAPPGEEEGSQGDTALTDLADGNPNPAWLPDLAQTWRSIAYQPRLYGAPTVNAGLAQFMMQWCRPDCPPEFEVDLTHGAVDAIERLLAAHLRHGDKVAVEDPCFLASINLLRNSGWQSVGVGMDEQGMLPEALQAALNRGVQALILTPRAHNPTGASLSRRRARALSAILEKHPHVLVIVDDHFALLSGQPYHSVIPRQASRWALVRSFSKALGPDVRVAAVASDAATSRLLRTRLSAGSNWVSHFLQDAIEFTITQPETASLMQRARSAYGQCRQGLESALAAQDIACWSQGDGLNLWLPLPLSTDDQAVALAMARQGWLVRPGSVFAVQQAVSGLRITVSTLDEDLSQALAADLRQCLG